MTSAKGRAVAARVAAWESRLGRVAGLIDARDGLSDAEADGFLREFVELDSVVRAASAHLRGPFPRPREAARLLDEPVIDVRTGERQSLDSDPPQAVTLDDYFAAMDARYRALTGMSGSVSLSNFRSKTPGPSSSFVRA